MTASPDADPDLRAEAEEAARAGQPLRSGEALPKRTTRLVPTPVQAVTAGALAVALFGAPFLADLALARFGVRSVAGVALGFAMAVAVARFVVFRRPLRLLADTAVPTALLGAAFASEDERWLLLVPALVNALLAVSFGRSALLARPGAPSIVERGARLMQSYLPGFVANYCRWLTFFWAAWFAAFALAIAWAALGADRDTWRFVATTLYFGSIAVVIALEWLHRKIWFRNYGSGPIDRVFGRLFPAEATERGRRSQEYLTEMHRTLYGRSRFDG